MKWQIGYLAACAAVIGGAVAYVLCDFGGWPLLMYLPYERIWLVADSPPSASAMVYPGMLLWGASGALFGAASTLVLATVIARKKSSKEGATATIAARSLHLWTGWALSAFVFATLYFFWGLWPF